MVAGCVCVEFAFDHAVVRVLKSITSVFRAAIQLFAVALSVCSALSLFVRRGKFDFQNVLLWASRKCACDFVFVLFSSCLFLARKPVCRSPLMSTSKFLFWNGMGVCNLWLFASISHLKSVVGCRTVVCCHSRLFSFVLLVRRRNLPTYFAPLACDCHVNNCLIFKMSFVRVVTMFCRLPLFFFDS